MDVSFCVAALHVALRRFGTPTIVNTDQGSQFTSVEFLKVVQDQAIEISMDGQGCWRDKVRVERLWLSLKNECALLHAFQDPHEARQRIRAWFDFYNDERPHQALEYPTPTTVYKRDLKTVKRAA